MVGRKRGAVDDGTVEGTMHMLMMNMGFFGIHSFRLQQTAINPLFTLIGANAHDLSP